MNWRAEGKGVDHPFKDQQLNAQLQAIERTINHWNQSLESIRKQKKQQESIDNEDDDNDDESLNEDPISRDDAIYGVKKYIEEVFLSKKFNSITQCNI